MATTTEEKVPVRKADDPTPGDMILLAVEKGADTDQLTKLMELQERWQANRARVAFAEAMVAFRADPPDLQKNANVHFKGDTGKTTDYDHSTLDHVEKVIGEKAASCGLSFAFSVKQDGSMVSVTCRVLHALGHYEEVSLSGGHDNTGNKSSIQALGSTVTYLSRYALQAAFGVSPRGEDKDGYQADPGAPITKVQTEALRAELVRVEGDETMFCAMMGVESIDDLMANQYTSALHAIRQKGKKSS